MYGAQVGEGLQLLFIGGGDGQRITAVDEPQHHAVIQRAGALQRVVDGRSLLDESEAFHICYLLKVLYMSDVLCGFLWDDLMVPGEH